VRVELNSVRLTLIGAALTMAAPAGAPAQPASRTQSIESWTQRKPQRSCWNRPGWFPFFEPRTAKIRFWREQPPEKRDRDAIRAFPYDLGLTLKKYCLLY
jgi:hypothetical protein